MTWLTDLLKDYPALAVAEQRLKLHEEEFARLKAENERLARENAELRAKLDAVPPTSFITERGALWRVVRGGLVEEIAYCPTCRLAMSAFPPGSNDTLSCSKCGFFAPFRPFDVPRIAAKLSDSRPSEN